MSNASILKSLPISGIGHTVGSLLTPGGASAGTEEEPCALMTTAGEKTPSKLHTATKPA